MLSWYMIVQRFIYFRNAHDEMYQFEERFWSGIDLAQLYREGRSNGRGHAMMGMESIFRAGFKEFSAWRNSRTWIREALSRASAGHAGAMMREEERLSEPGCSSRPSVPPAPISACSVPCGASCLVPWPGQRPQATLATVAPVFPEALVAPPSGLFAAIPAVLAFNRLASRVDVFTNRYDTFVDEFSGIPRARRMHCARAKRRR